MATNKVIEKVTIGIPTYNRSNRLPKAILSALGQDCPNIEVLVCDNASTDDTEKICRELAKKHANLKYYRQEVNRGMTNNFNDVLDMSSGEYFMWLSDDDYIDSNYVSTCLKFLKENLTYSLVVGNVNLMDDNQIVDKGFVYDVKQNIDIFRVISYYWNPCEGGVIYGLMKKKQAQRSRMPNCLAGDWMFVAGMAKQGKIKTIVETNIYKNKGGISDSTEKIVKSLRLHQIQATFPYLSITVLSSLEVLRYNNAWREMSFITRALDAILLFYVNFIRHVIIQNLKRMRFYILTNTLGLERYKKLRAQYLAINLFK